MAPWTSRETNALYLGIARHGHNFVRIKNDQEFCVELAARSASACWHKVYNDNKKFLKREALFQELLFEQMLFNGAEEVKNQLREVQNQLQEAGVIQPTDSEEVLKSINDQFTQLETKVSALFEDFTLELKNVFPSIEVDEGDERVQEEHDVVDDLVIFSQLLGNRFAKFGAKVNRQVTAWKSGFKKYFN